MNENKRIIDDFETTLISMATSRTHLESIRHDMMNGISNPENRIVTFDIDALDATILTMFAQEQLIRTLFVEYKARQD